MRYGSGNLDVCWFAGFGETAEGDLEAEGAEDSQVGTPNASPADLTASTPAPLMASATARLKAFPAPAVAMALNRLKGPPLLRTSLPNALLPGGEPCRTTPLAHPVTKPIRERDFIQGVGWKISMGHRGPGALASRPARRNE